MNPILAAAVVVLGAILSACTQQDCDGQASTYKSSGSCGPDTDVEVFAGASSGCAVGAFTGFNSEVAGFPQATNDTQDTRAPIRLPDGGAPLLQDGGRVTTADGGVASQVRSCRLRTVNDAGFVVACEILACARDGGNSCKQVATCTATLTP